MSLALTGVVILGVLGKWVAWRTRLPSILILLLTGLAIGPLARAIFGADLRLLDPDLVFGHVLTPVVSLSVAIILYEGGLSLQLREVKDVGHVIRNLVTLGALATWLIGSVLSHALLGLSWPIALLLGAILVVTGPTVIGPLLQQVRPRGAVGPILKWEGIIIDPIGATLAVLVFEAIRGGRPPLALVGDLLLTAAAGCALGVLGARFLVWCLETHALPDNLDNAASLATLLGVVTAANCFHDESGLIAATVMGIALANQRRVSIEHVVEFKENLRVLLISALFIVLAARLRAEHLRVALEPGALAFLAALILVARPLAVLLSTARSSLSRRERLFLACLAPRGIVAAAVASVFALRLAEAGTFAPQEVERLVAVTFLVIVSSVTVYGLLAAPLARRLGLSEADPQGLLLLGAHPAARELALALAVEGHRLLLVDSNQNNVDAARAVGLEAVHANVLSEFVADELDLGGIGRLLALTPNDEVNALACQRFSDVLGRRGVYRLAPRAHGDSRHDSAFSLGRILFAPGATNQDLYERRSRGARLARIPLGPGGLAELGEGVLPLFLIPSASELLPVPADQPPAASPGAVLLALVEAAVPPASEDPLTPA
ncbi:MAG: cation:proton antiporter [Planctomycetota bacterium]